MVNFAQKLNGASEVNSHLTRLYWKLLNTNSYNSTSSDSTSSSAAMYSNLSSRYKFFESVKNLTYSHYEVVGGSSTVMHVRIPNYFQALLTIFICVVIMSTTICVILRTKYWCMKYQRARGARSNGKGSSIGLSEVNVVVVKRDVSPTSSSASESVKNDKSDSGDKSPPQNYLLNGTSSFMLRRMSGPFNDDALEFAHESYKQKKSMKTSINSTKPGSKLVTSLKPEPKLPRNHSTPTLTQVHENGVQV